MNNDNPIAVMNSFAVFGPNQQVKWDVRPGGWAGEGSAKVVGFNPTRPFFGSKKGSGQDTPGPAYEIELATTHKHRVWVGPGEIAAV
jgi:hypothetical protein